MGYSKYTIKSVSNNRNILYIFNVIVAVQNLYKNTIAYNVI